MIWLGEGRRPSTDIPAEGCQPPSVFAGIVSSRGAGRTLLAKSSNVELQTKNDFIPSNQALTPPVRVTNLGSWVQKSKMRFKATSRRRSIPLFCDGIC